ncbi:helix-turn-helix domain-containing protein [Anatilimnocola floriformis]|uniref:helix-turn-helix domain-containing protein n=1 Tax=Anatilimnocola floriformis TaxID=2948575 RepID=UPI0036F2893E
MPNTFAPSRIAERFGVDVSKVLRWIEAGELKAINVATRLGGRPRWRITEESLVAFEQARTNITPFKPGRRRPPRVERRYY